MGPVLPSIQTLHQKICNFNVLSSPFYPDLAPHRYATSMCSVPPSIQTLHHTDMQLQCAQFPHLSRPCTTQICSFNVLSSLFYPDLAPHRYATSMCSVLPSIQTLHHTDMQLQCAQFSLLSRPCTTHICNLNGPSPPFYPDLAPEDMQLQCAQFPLLSRPCTTQICNFNVLSSPFYPDLAPHRYATSMCSVPPSIQTLHHTDMQLQCAQFSLLSRPCATQICNFNVLSSLFYPDLAPHIYAT